ncbi:MAG: hypothetical protein IJM98_04830, partial [Oscillospiraceae bacterium]|nr:hypothetical protein [Oscillospiraceae bacterium]
VVFAKQMTDEGKPCYIFVCSLFFRSATQGRPYNLFVKHTGNLQKNLCHSERSEESVFFFCGLPRAYALAMTNAGNSPDRSV